MAVTIKSEKEIELMRESCRLLSIVHEEMGKALKPGMSTYDIDKLGEDMIRSFGCSPNFKNYHGVTTTEYRKNLPSLDNKQG